MKKQRGFTLIELLVVIAIIGVLSVVGLTSYQSANVKARDSRRAADIQQLRSALEMYRSSSPVSEYPNISGICTSSASCWTTLMGASNLAPYLSGQVIVDPKNTGSNVYSYERPTASSYNIRYTPEVGSAVTYTNP